MQFFSDNFKNYGISLHPRLRIRLPGQLHLGRSRSEACPRSKPGRDPPPQRHRARGARPPRDLIASKRQNSYSRSELLDGPKCGNFGPKNRFILLS